MIPILYLSHCGSSIGGGEKQLYYLVKNLDKNKFLPYVICPDDGIFAEKLRQENIHTTILNLPQWRKVKSIFSRGSASNKLIDFVQERNIQLIHTSDSWLNPYLCQVKKQSSLPIISHVRNILTPNQIIKYKFCQMDHIIAISDQSRTTLVNNGIDNKRVDVLRNCIDLSEFQPKQIIRKTEEFIVGLVGRIEPFKRQRGFVQIAAMVHTHEKSVKFIIIGSSLDMFKHKSYERKVKELISKEKLGDVIQFAGHRNDIPQALQELDLLVTLSAGSVIAEAMASGLPVVATPIGSTADMIVDGVTGWIAPADPLETISNKIIQLVNDNELYTKMGTAARTYAEENFNIESHVERIQNIYEDMLNNHKS